MGRRAGAQHAKGVATVLGSYLPEVLRTAQLLEVLPRDGFELLHEAKDPDDLLGLLAGERTEELLDREVPSGRPVEADLSHDCRLNTEVNRTPLSAGSPSLARLSAAGQC